MKSPWLLILLALAVTLSSCRKSEQSLAESSPGNSAPPTATASPPVVPIKPTPEQRNSVVRVRMVFGGLPPRDFPAVVLHPDEIANKGLLQGNDQYILVLLKGRRKEDLAWPNCRFIVSHHKSKELSQPEAETR